MMRIVISEGVEVHVTHPDKIQNIVEILTEVQQTQGQPSKLGRKKGTRGPHWSDEKNQSFIDRYEELTKGNEDLTMNAKLTILSSEFDSPVSALYSRLTKIHKNAPTAAMSKLKIG